jgi:ankyrin repeat protein
MRVSFRFSVTLTALLALGAGVARDARAESARGQTLVDAARRRDAAAVSAQLKSHANPNETQPDGATALHWAAHWDDRAMAESLLRAGASVNRANEYGATALWLAAVNGSAAMVETLLDWGADPNVALQFGETPLSAAARGGAVGVVRALVSHGADVDAKEKVRGQTALMWAAAEGHVDVMRALLDGGAAVSSTTSTGSTPLLFVARHGSIDAARLLLDRGAAIDGQDKAGATPLLTAVIRGHVELAEFLLDRGANPNRSGKPYNALHWAAGTWETVLTTDYKFQESDGEWAALRGIPSKDAKIGLIKALVAHGADVNANASSEPVRFGYTMIGQWGPAFRRGMTPFYIAAVAADVDVMRLLLALGADPTIGSVNHTTPLMVAAGRVRLDYESRIREEDAVDALKLLLETGADVNAINDAGETALHAAALAGLDRVVEYLVQQGASLTARTKDGKTALALAEGYPWGMQVVRRPSTAALLRKLGAR